MGVVEWWSGGVVKLSADGVASEWPTAVRSLRAPGVPVTKVRTRST